MQSNLDKAVNRLLLQADLFRKISAVQDISLSSMSNYMAPTEFATADEGAGMGGMALGMALPGALGQAYWAYQSLPGMAAAAKAFLPAQSNMAADDFVQNSGTF